MIMNWWRHHLTSTSAPFAFCVSETHIRPAAATGKSQDWELCVCKYAVIFLLGLINFPKKVIWTQSSFNNLEASVLQISQPPRFCYTCILTWQSEGMTCPYDKCPLREGNNRRPLSYFLSICIIWNFKHAQVTSFMTRPSSKKSIIFWWDVLSKIKLPTVDVPQFWH